MSRAHFRALVAFKIASSLALTAIENTEVLASTLGFLPDPGRAPPRLFLIMMFDYMKKLLGFQGLLLTHGMV